MIRPRQTCSACHFFVRTAGLDTGPVPLAVSETYREQAKSLNFSWVSKRDTLMCSHGVWDEGFNFDVRDRAKVIGETDRRDFCFFWKHRPGMFVPPAKVLQEREARYREARKERHLTLWGLWIAALALAANVWLTVAARLNLWPFCP